jgi:signal transduction histidine kinase
MATGAAAGPRATAVPPLRNQLFVALVVPAVLAMGALAFMADLVARRALEEALGARLCAVAQAAAATLSPKVLLLDRGDDESRVARSAKQKLEELRTSTEVGRIFLVLADGARLMVDTDAAGAVGDPYVRAEFDRAELTRVLAGEAAASILFTAPDGRPFKTGYAPFRGEGDELVAYVGVSAPASYTVAIDQLRVTLAVVAGVGFLFLFSAALLSARRVAVPLSALSEAAERVGAGELDTVIPGGGPREAQVLAETMRGMTRSLKARDEELQMMLAGIAHEVRNPLGGIELFGGLLKEDLEGDPRQKHVEKILKELGTLAKVVNDFLDFARRRAPEPRNLSVMELAFEVSSLVERDAVERGVTVALDVPRDLEVYADPESTKRALLNLVRNAVQAAPAKEGQVAIRAGQEDGGVALHVDDNGPGVPEDKREEIFQPFFTTKQKGTGLGLALVRKTAEAHGGRIGVGVAPLGGARFTLSLPAPPS